MLPKIGDIVARARTRERRSLEDVAARADVAPAILGALERGEPGMSTAALARVAQQLGLDGAALLLGQEVQRPGASVFLRHQGTQDFDHAAQERLDRALDAGRSLRFLNDRLGVAPGLRRTEVFPRRESGANAASDGYELARNVRRALGAPTEPLGDLAELLEDRFEIAVLVVPMGSTKMTAVGLRDGDDAAAVALNALDPQRRENPQLARVHLAHELCHILHDPSDGGLHLVVERADDDARGRHVERAEQRAKGFAAELLLPLQGLLQVLKTPAWTDSEAEGRALVAKARRHFSTPWEIAVNHLNHQGYLSDALRLTLLRQGAQGSAPGAIDTALPLPDGLSAGMRARLQRAHEAAIVTDGQVRVALGLSVDQPLPWVG